MADKAKDEIHEGFDRAVNMTPREIERWLGTDESKAVGESDGGESKGRRSAKRIIETCRKSKGELTDGDYTHMKRVRDYVNRHLEQRPTGNVEHTPWRHSLMNWGHDPLK